VLTIFDGTRRLDGMYSPSVDWRREVEGLTVHQAQEPDRKDIDKRRPDVSRSSGHDPDYGVRQTDGHVIGELHGVGESLGRDGTMYWQLWAAEADFRQRLQLWWWRGRLPIRQVTNYRSTSRTGAAYHDRQGTDSAKERRGEYTIFPRDTIVVPTGRCSLLLGPRQGQARTASTRTRR